MVQEERGLMMVAILEMMVGILRSTTKSISIEPIHR